MTVYLDVVWALNFLFDSFLLYLTAIILKRRVRILRLIFGGLIGSILILLTVTPLHLYSGHPLSKLTFSVLMILAAFGYKRFRYFLSGLMTLYLSTFLIGGTIIGVHYFIKFDLTLSSEVMVASVKGFGDPISWLFVLIGFPLAWHFSRKNIENFEMTKIQYDRLVKVSIESFGEHFLFTGLVDSGNQLYDPISKVPVMFVSIKNQFEKIPASIIKLAEDPELILTDDSSIPVEFENKLRIIPAKVVGQEHQIIVAIKPEKISIEVEGETIKVEKGLISFTMQQLSADDTFQCIVHPKMLTGLKQSNRSTKVS